MKSQATQVNQWMDRPMQCVDCRAEVTHGAAFHKMEVHRGSKTWTELRCLSCAEYLAWAMWPEDFGPCPYQRHDAGRC